MKKEVIRAMIDELNKEIAQGESYRLKTKNKLARDMTLAHMQQAMAERRKLFKRLGTLGKRRMKAADDVDQVSTQRLAEVQDSNSATRLAGELAMRPMMLHR